MKILLQISFVFTALFFMTMTSCQPKATDPCEKINCLNGGACIDGTCACPTGYTGLRCEKRIVDPCENKKCLNDGTCINGSCNCPPGYSGVNCEIVSDCYVNNKGTVVLNNKSATGKQYAVYVDGVLVGTPRYGESATFMTYVGSHTLLVKVLNSSSIACSASTIQVSRCTTSSWSCQY